VPDNDDTRDRDLGIEWLSSQLGESDGAGEPEAAEPESTVPEPAAPESAARDSPLPETAAPASAAPETAAPAPTVPETAAPAPTVPETAAPASAATAPSNGFVWGLTPTVAPDPKLETEAQDAAGASAVEEEVHIPEAPARPVPVAPATPAVAAEVPAAPDLPLDVAPAPDLPFEATPAPDLPFEVLPAATDVPVELPAARRTEADLEPDPWWTTPVQTPLVPTDEEAAATRLLKTPEPAASVPVVPLPLDAPTVAPPLVATVGRQPAGRSGGGSARTAVRMLLWLILGLLGVAVLVALFYLGQKLVGGAAPVAAPNATATATPKTTPAPTPTPAPTAEATGPQAVGVHAWDTLGGGECLQPYTSPWEQTFTVVDCAAPHAAQLVYRGVFAGDAGTAFPGEAALAAQINALCSAPGVIDLAVAGALPDLQLQGSYPITAEQWTSGPRHYYCFVSRSSAKPLTASIAGPGPTPAG
jgi:hypothetical protein